MTVLMVTRVGKPYHFNFTLNFKSYCPNDWLHYMPAVIAYISRTCVATLLRSKCPVIDSSLTVLDLRYMFTDTYSPILFSIYNLYPI